MIGHWVDPLKLNRLLICLPIKAALRLACENAFQFRYWHRASFGHGSAEVSFGPSLAVTLFCMRENLLDGRR